MAEEEGRPKQTAFRLPQRTLDILDNIVARGKARTRTDALIWAVDSTRDLVSKDDFVKAMEEAKKQQIEQRHTIERLERKMEAMSEAMKIFSLIKQDENDSRHH